SGPARPEHRPAATSRRSLQACIASLPLQSSLMSDTYLKSDHFNGGGSVQRVDAMLAHRSVSNDGTDEEVIIMKHLVSTILCISMVALGGTSAPAQEAVLPKPELPFQGKIGGTVKDSTPDFPKGVEAPAGAPNILLILTDDVGFGATSTFGGPIQTPNLQRIADNGLRYNMYHTTALCSPTRAALITGRNHHSVASGVITEFATGYPGYNSLVPKSAGSVGAVLRENGYNTSWFGKMHNVPDWMSSQAGPFDLWPNGLGFEY